MTAKKSFTNMGLLKLAWDNANGWKGVCGSLDFRLSIIVWLLCSPAWLSPGWWHQVLVVLPTVLGFTLSGFAIFLGFGSDSFKRFLARDKDPDKSLYMSVSAAFLIFVSCQLAALLYALVADALYFPTPNFMMPIRRWIEMGSYIGGGVGYFIFLFSLTLSLRAALRIYRLSRWYNLYLNKDSAREGLRRRRVVRRTKRAC
jgi:hypothetical protein